MKKNAIQFQKIYSLPELIKDFGAEERYHQTLYQWR